MFSLNFNDFSTWLSIVMFISLWNCGFVAITRKGKIGYFLLAFFERKKKVLVPVESDYHERLIQEIVLVHVNAEKDFELIRPVAHKQKEINLKINEYLEEKNLHVFDLNKFLDEIGTTRREEKIYCEVKEDIFPDWIKDPLIVCITCLASVHGTILYTLIVHFRNWNWNVLEWITIIIPVAFVGEFLWRLKTVFDKKIMNG